MDEDPLAELNRLATNALSTSTAPLSPTPADISRWQALFAYTPAEASALITAHRADVTREPVPESHWELVKGRLEGKGYDKEAYEHSLELKGVLEGQSSVVHDADGKKWWLIRLGGLLGDKEKIREVAALGEDPEVVEGVAEGERKAWFAMVDEDGKKRIEEWVEGQRAL